MKRRILDGLRAALPVDGVLLALHGAGVADGVEDIEGDLCVAVRELVGPATPIAAVYDLHGNMTEAMRDSCELTLPCKLYPHTDFHDRGVEAVALLREIIAGRLRPVTVMRRLPMLPYIVTTQEGFIPAEVNAVCAELAQRPGVIDCSWFHGFPYADIAAPCPAVVCTTAGDLALAERCADEVAQWIWTRRENFRPSFPSPAEGVAQALAAAHGPVVVNEYADNPGGGTPGDGTHLLRAVLDAQPAPGTCCSRPSTTPLSSIRPGRPAWAPPSACRWAASRAFPGRTAARECLRQGHHRRPFHQPRRLHVRRRALRPGRDVPLAHPGRGRHRRLARRTDL